MRAFQQEWIRADEVRVGDLVVVPSGGSSRAFFTPEVPPPEDAEPLRVASVEAPGSFTLEGGSTFALQRRTQVLRVIPRS